MSMVLLALLAAAADRPVVVSSITTPQLVELCRGKDDDPTANFCTGYILAAFDALSLARQICPSPARASNMMVASTTRKYLRKRAKKSTVAPAFAVRTALREAFPCKRR
ncbi:Rap1a/Tai family immunity protein [Sphingomonas phyllosphaerae]|uniref:Rap1a/Tai family immunity protein n=1 Tax=Sphingomonas phyllosphaerae TaxID=257003 RepID=UPI0004186F38|nr:Rap1a/Tai family immunity protein [Sphingomonas phyllosphaerae]